MNGKVCIIIATVVCFSVGNLRAQIATGPVVNPGNNHFYYLVGPTDWTNAEAQAVSLGGHLVTINDQAENDWVLASFGQFGGTDRRLLIGLTDEGHEGVWTWTSGEPVTFTNWAPGEPNNGAGYYPYENYVFIRSPGENWPLGSWNDILGWAPDQTAMWGVVEIIAIPPTNGLIAYFPFNGNADDASGNGNDGIQAGVTQAVDRFGTGGSAYQFNGSNSVITVAPLSSANLPELTVSMWVYPSAIPTGTAGQFINKWRGYSYSLEDYQMGLRNDLRIEFGNGRHGAGYFELPNHCLITTPNQLSVGQWYHIVATLDSAGTGKVWVNGSLWAQDYILPLLPPASEPVRIGQARLAAWSPFNGAIADTFIGIIDDVRFYDRAITAGEVQQLYSPGTVLPPQITTQPQNQVVLEGDTATFNVVASGTPAPNYQWRLNGTNIAGAMGSNLILTNARTTNAGVYTVVVYNYVDTTTSSNAVLTVNAPPAITHQPKGTIGYWGGNAQFSVIAQGAPAPSYLWHKESFAIPWGTNSILTLTNLEFSDAGKYWVAITNLAGGTNSADALLLVNPAGIGLGMHPFLTITGTVGKTFGIEYATEVSPTSVWTPVTNLTLISTNQEWIDTSVNAVVGQRRFYRVIAIP